MPDEPNNSENSGSEDSDVACKHCGYNLRGQSGDVRQCPECGVWNSVRNLWVSQDSIEKEMRRMESAPALCVAVAILGWFILCIMLPDMIRCRSLPVSNDLACCCLWPGPIGSIIWIVGVVSFRSACGGHPRWIASLARYHVFGLVWATIIAAIVIATSIAVEIFWKWAFGPSWVILLHLLTMSVLGFGFIRTLPRFVRPWHQKWRKAMEEIWKKEATQRLQAKP